MRLIHSFTLLAAIAGSGFATTGFALDKQQMTSEMIAIATQIQTLKGDATQAPLVERLQARYHRLSELLGGDDPAAQIQGGVTPYAPQSVPQTSALVASPPTGCSVATTSFANSTPVPIVDLATQTSTIVVSGLGTTLWDVDLHLNITHTYAADLDVTLTSPNGTVINITSDNGGANDNVFAGTLFDDQALNGVVDYLYTDMVAASPLSPEEALDRLRGLDPNGTWTLTVTDDAGVDTGTLNSWSLDLTTLASAPSPTTTSGSNSTVTPILDLATFTSTITISGAPLGILDVNLTTAIQHTYAADLDITLTSPAGTVVVVTTDNGAGNDNVFNGTTWDDQAPQGCIDYVYTNAVAAPLLAPEGHFSRFLGEDPNGVWTLTVTDDAGIDTGTLNSWSLAIQSGSCGGALPPVAFCNPGAGGVIPCPCANAPSGLGRGCDNSAATGGASISATGFSQLSGDTLVFTTANERATATSIVLAGTASIVAGINFGQGVRCVGGSLKRLYVKTAVAGSITAPAGADPSISTQHANLLDPLTGGTHRYYMVYYRDPIVLGACAPNFTFNGTNALDVTWAP